MTIAVRQLRGGAGGRVPPNRGRLLSLGPLLVPLVLLVAWQLLAATLGDFYVAAPADAVSALQSGVAEGWLGDQTLYTLYAVAYGFAMASVLGLILGFSLGLSPFLYHVFEPIVMALYSLPKIVLFPILLFVFGVGTSAEAWLGFNFGVFPVLVLTMSATRNVRPITLKLARSLGLSGPRTARLIILPAIVPQVAIGLRMAFGLTFLGVIMAEMFASQRGLGFLLSQSVTLHDMPRMYGVVLLLFLLAGGGTAIFLWWEKRLHKA